MGRLITHDPVASGSLCVEKSTPYFADNDLGTGSAAALKCQVGEEDVWEILVVLTWLDWNLVEFKAVDSVTWWGRDKLDSSSYL